MPQYFTLIGCCFHTAAETISNYRQPLSAFVTCDYAKFYSPLDAKANSLADVNFRSFLVKNNIMLILAFYANADFGQKQK